MKYLALSWLVNGYRVNVSTEARRNLLLNISVLVSVKIKAEEESRGNRRTKIKLILCTRSCFYRSLECDISCWHEKGILFSCALLFFSAVWVFLKEAGFIEKFKPGWNVDIVVMCEENQNPQPLWLCQVFRGGKRGRCSSIGLVYVFSVYFLMLAPSETQPWPGVPSSPSSRGGPIICSCWWSVCVWSCGSCPYPRATWRCVSRWPPQPRCRLRRRMR